MKKDDKIAAAAGTVSVVSSTLRDQLSRLTAVVDHPGTNAVDQWMDGVSGYGHRFIHGHHLSDAVDVYNQHGVDGLWEFAQHLGRDFCTPHGLPLPGAKGAVDFLEGVGIDVSPGVTVEWLSANIIDLVAAASGGLTLYMVYRDRNKPSILFMGAAMKLALGIATTNPLLIGGALLATGVGVYRSFNPKAVTPGNPASLGHSKLLAELVASSDIPTNAERTQILHDLSREIGILPVAVTNENRSDVLEGILADAKACRKNKGMQ